MWILTPSITSAFAAATGASTSASSEQLASACAQSLLWRSSASPSATWQRRLKQNSWTTHLSGAICEPSLGESFTDWWTSSLAAIRASHSAPPASDSAPKTQDTSGRLSQPELLQCDQVSVSLKTSRDISALGFPTCCKTWQEWVTERRGAWRQRVNAARPTSGRGSSSWPTTAARDYKGTSPNYSTRKDGKSRADQLAVAVDLEERATWPTPTVQEAGKIGNQANHGQLALSNHPAIRGEVSRDKYEKSKHGQAAPASSSSLGSRQGLSWPTARSLDGQINESLESWTARRDRKQAEGINLHRPLPIAVMQEQFPTPRTCDWKSSPNADSNIKRMVVGQATLAEFVHAKHKKGDLWSTPRTGATESSRPNNKGGIPLADQAKRESRNWATPQTFDHVDLVRTPEKLAQTRAEKNAGCMNLREQVHYPEMDHSRNAWGTPTARDHKSGRGNEDRQYKELTPMVERQQSGKLNPRWVETLMGLPIGWTMPSCTSPQTIAPMSCDSLAMELCPPPQSELSEFSLAS